MAVGGSLLAGGYFLFRKAERPASVPPKSPYIAASACSACHPDIAETYRRTGMGRSFYRPRPETAVEAWTTGNTFYHQASERHYTMYQRDGRFFQRRRPADFHGQETNVVEKEIHYVMGSGNHARTYLHRTPEGRLVELPVAWYSQKGGYWAMNPGYDRPDHQDFRRVISLDCLFCHNGYPTDDPGAYAGLAEPIYPSELPEGIDCQRCHGPGRRHVEAAESGGSPEAIRSAIVNPKRLSRDRQIEVCLQCHLETTSRRLPYSLRRWNRGAFSYRPGEPLGDYILHFDHPPGAGYDDKFEIAHAAYRLRKSACFRRSGTMTCTTCHDPHDAPRGAQAVARYVAACRTCHPSAHSPAPDCLACHMPKRRTDDVVHVVMTDHFIQRRKPARDLLAPRRETHDSEENAYTGEVVLYYPEALPDGPAKELYLAAAQVFEGANLAGGIPRLQAAVERHRPEEAEFYFVLAEAYRRAGERERSIPLYREAVRRNPGLTAAVLSLSLALSGSGRLAEAAAALESFLSAQARRPAVLNNLGEVYLQQGKPGDAIRVLTEALAANPDLPEAHNNLGEAFSQKGERARAEQAFRDAIRIRPDFPTPHNNLANLLAASGDLPQAERHFRNAIRFGPRYAAARYNYGMALAQAGRAGKAVVELEAAVRLDPALAEAHNNLGNLYAGQGRAERAAASYQRAIELKPSLADAHFNLGTLLAQQGRRREARLRFEEAIRRNPDYYEAHFNLAAVLAQEGDTAAAGVHWRKAAASPDQRLRQAALEALAQMERR
jgi:predicted CXXCH cytochrome family protein